MSWQIDAYVTGLVITGISALIIASIALQYRERAGAVPLALTLCSLAFWSIAGVFEASATTFALKILWSQVSYVGIVTLPAFLVIFASHFTQRDRWLSPLTYALLAVIPAITFALALTNRRHGLIWSGLEWAPGTDHIAVYRHGPWFWVYLAHFYVLIIASAVLLLTEARRVHRLYRRQSIVIVVAMIPSIAVNALYLFVPQVFNGRDWTPVSFFVSVALVAWAFAELQLLSLVPMAREEVFDSIHDGVIAVDATRLIIDANPAARDILGANDIVGQDVLAVFEAVEGLSEVPDISAVPFRLGKDQVLEYPEQPILSGHMAVDSKHIEWRLSPIRRNRRALPGYLIILYDVTEQRDAEAALRRMNATLETRISERTAAIRSQQEQSDAILRSVSDGIFMTDRDLVIRYVNPAFSQLSGYTYTETLGEPAEHYVGETIHKLLKSTQADGQVWQGETRAELKDGRLRDIDLTIAPVRDHSGVAVGYVCTERDITRTKNLERARKGILDNISHQLRTPLTNLKLYSHLLWQADLPEHHHRSVEVVREQILWLQTVVEEILEMTSLDSGEGSGAWTIVPAALIADHLGARFGPRATDAGISLTLRPIPSREVAVRGDAGRLTQALAEIVKNALTFTPEGGSVRISAVETAMGGKPGVTFAVSDTGFGIPEDELPRVLERFFRGRITETGQFPGAGLGLNIAQSIVDAHNGCIEVASSDRGTTVSVWLPTVTEAEAPGSGSIEPGDT